MERIAIIKNFFDLVGLTKAERLTLIKALMKEWSLTTADLSTPADLPVVTSDDFGIDSEHPSKQETAEPAVVDASEENSLKTDTLQEQISLETPPEPASPVKRRGRPKKNENGIHLTPMEEKKQSLRGHRKKTDIVSQTPDSAIEPPIKRRGRRKKSESLSCEAIPDVSRLETQEASKVPPEKFSAKDEELIAETAGITDLRMLLEDEPPVRSKTTKRRNPAFRYLADYPSLKKLIVGRDYPFEFLYQWEGGNLLSPYVLSDLMPIGIYIPYKSMVFGKYRGFIISIYDEQIFENSIEALEEARKMQPIDEEGWSVMNAIQFGVAKTSSEILNRMLAKIGGDRLKQTYRLLSPKSNHVTGIGKFRYTIDVK